VIVVDASVLVPALAEDGPAGAAARQRLRGDHLMAPELVELEVVSALRRQVSAGRIEPPRADTAVRLLRGLVIRTASHYSLIDRIWELRHTVSPYDGAYVALAELMNLTLVTADARLARAPGIGCKVEVLSA
jgi:predicted nucleic acid-binding protein